MQKYIQEGKALDYTNGTGLAIASGDVVIIGSLAAVAMVDIADGATGSVLTEGVVELTKDAPLVISMGDELFWNTTDKEVTKTATDKPIGIAAAGALSAATKVQVKLAGNGNGIPVAAVVAAHGSTANLTAVPGTFADEAAVQTYLLMLRGEIETRLDAIEAKQDAILTSLKNAGIMASA